MWLIRVIMSFITRLYKMGWKCFLLIHANGLYCSFVLPLGDIGIGILYDRRDDEVSLDEVERIVI